LLSAGEDRKRAVRTIVWSDAAADAEMHGPAAAAAAAVTEEMNSPSDTRYFILQHRRLRRWMVVA